MSGADARPPRLIERLLERLLPASLREPYIGDLREEYAERYDRYGWQRAVSWYVLQLLRVRPRTLESAVWNLEGGRRPRAMTIRLMMSGLSCDVRDSLRALRRWPGSSAIIVGTVAVALAAGTLVFSIFHGVVLRPFPYPDVESLVNVYMVNPRMTLLGDPVSQRNGSRFPLSYHALEAWRSSESLPFTALGGYQNGSARAVDGADGAPIRVSTVTAGVFESLGVSAALGRVLSSDEDRIGGPRVVVLSDGAWRGRYGSDPSILGRELRFGDESLEVIGVMPAGFHFPANDVEAWIPFTDRQRQANPNVFIVHGIARLRPGVSVEEASRAMNEIAERTGTTIASTPAGSNVISRRELVLGDVDQALSVLMGTVLVVLLVAVLNVTSLLLARAEGRSTDLALRAALGAGSGHILRLTSIDALLLAGVGGAVGAAVAWAGLGPALALLPEALPRQENIAFNGSVGSFAISAIVVTALLASVLPAFQAIRTPPRELLSRAGRAGGSSRAGNRTRAVLVVVEVAGAVTLLVGAALLALSYSRLMAVDMGFDPSNVVAVNVMLPADVTSDAGVAAAWSGRLVEDLRAVPGVEDAVLSGDVPFSGGTASAMIEYEAGDGSLVEYDASLGIVGAGHFRFMATDMIAGREFEPGEHSHAGHGVIVNRTVAETLWPGVSAIGRRIRSDGEWHHVIGVAGDIRTVGPADDPAARVYFPRSPDDRFPWILARTAVPAATLIETIEATIEGSEPGIQLFGTSLLDRQLDETVAHPRFRTRLLAGLALVAALLAMIGVYGIVSHTVASQRREIGIRKALGEPAASILRRVVGRGVLLAVAGGAAGLVMAVPLGRLLTRFLFQVDPAEPVALAGVLVAVAVVTAAAAWIPARRASSVDPVEALGAD